MTGTHYSKKNYTHLLEEIYKPGVGHPLVSMIVRTYNREKLLSRCLDHIDQQIYPHIEVIVVNDGGKDVNHLLEKRPFHYHYVRHGVNLGKAAALNTGLKIARGKYISIVDDDDLLDPEHIAILVTALENSNYRVAYTNSLMILEHNEENQGVPNGQLLQYSQPHDLQLLLRMNYIPILNILFERTLLHECGYANEHYEILEEWDFLIRLALKAEFYHIKEITAQYSQRIQGDNATQKLALESAKYRNIIVQSYDHFMNAELINGLFRPKQQLDRKLARFLYISDSATECKQVITEFMKLFQDITWVELCIYPLFHQEEINKLEHLEESTMIRFVHNPDEEFTADFFYHFDFVIESNNSKRLDDKISRVKVPVLSVKDLIHAVKNHPVFGVLYKTKRKVEPLVSIIIPTKNQLKYTEKCIESIYRYTTIPFELIIVDNASSDGTVAYLQQLSKEKENIKVIFNDENKGYGYSNNQGIAYSSGKYILFLNNDVIVTKDWLDTMIQALESNPKYGIIGPVSNFVAGIQQINDPAYSVDNLESYSMVHREKYKNVLVPAERVIGFCMLVKREVVNEIGGFDLLFETGNFEDDDFCIRAALAGYQCVIAKEVFIHHFGSVTLKNESDINHNSVYMKNGVRFMLKWELSSDVLTKGFRLEQIKKSFKTAEHYSPIIANASVLNHLKQAMELFHSEKYGECEEVLLQCLQLDRHNKVIWYNLLVIYMQLKDLTKAAECFDHLNIRDVSVGSLKVIWYILNKKMDEAKQLLQHLLLDHPENPELIKIKYYFEDYYQQNRFI